MISRLNQRFKGILTDGDLYLLEDALVFYRDKENFEWENTKKEIDKLIEKLYSFWECSK